MGQTCCQADQGEQALYYEPIHPGSEVSAQTYHFLHRNI